MSFQIDDLASVASHLSRQFNITVEDSLSIIKHYQEFSDIRDRRLNPFSGIAVCHSEYPYLKELHKYKKMKKEQK